MLYPLFYVPYSLFYVISPVYKHTSAQVIDHYTLCRYQWPHFIRYTPLHHLSILTQQIWLLLRPLNHCTMYIGIVSLSWYWLNNIQGGFRGLFPYIAALTSHSCKPNCLSVVEPLPPFTNRLRSQNCSSYSSSSSLIRQENLRRHSYGKQFKQSLCRLVAGRRVEVAFFIFGET